MLEPITLTSRKAFFVTDKPKNTQKRDESQKRQERLDEALRANLKKRKQQSRKRADADQK
ncbi:MAG: hypothetical protein COB59_07480 [Rhodospirillaceae bacterium]|nr:MAG: hypothetical protein COB59_07480 [Rhodospirillaceae bacterium]